MYYRRNGKNQANSRIRGILLQSKRCNKNNDIRVAVLPKDDERNTRMGNVETNKQGAERENGNKENIMLFAFYEFSRADRQR